jgi:hypothetical protein
VLRIGVEWESLTLETKNKKGGKLGAGRTFGQRNSYLYRTIPIYLSQLAIFIPVGVDGS